MSARDKFHRARAMAEDRYLSTCEFHDWWQKMAPLSHQWPNKYEVALHAWKESAMKTRRRLKKP